MPGHHLAPAEVSPHSEIQPVAKPPLQAWSPRTEPGHVHSDEVGGQAAEETAKQHKARMFGRMHSTLSVGLNPDGQLTAEEDGTQDLAPLLARSKSMHTTSGKKKKSAE